MTTPLSPLPGPQISAKDLLTPVWRSWFNQLYQYISGTTGMTGVAITSGTGSPNGFVTGNPGDMYLNKSGGLGATLYVKETGTGTNTGWVAK